MNSANAVFQLLPSMDRILNAEQVAAILSEVGAGQVKKMASELLQEIRKDIGSDPQVAEKRLQDATFFDDFCAELIARLRDRHAGTLVSVLNLTGTILHTNLGRAVLPDSAIEALTEVARAPCNIEYDLLMGKRGDRDLHTEQLIQEITGAEAATVVNNNAAAVLLVLNTLARDKEVIISRGELVEIGGSFRIPDVMKAANATLHEVGTTNRTHASDYQQAINPQTGLIMKVHTSNYAVQGFTATVPENELAALARDAALPFVSDLGSGTLIDMTSLGLPREPTVQSILAAGAQLVTFSGDKLLGGPQAGIIAGSKELIERIKSNPLKRALRVDKLTVAALIAVLRLYQDPQRLGHRLPLIRDLTRDPEQIRALCEELLPRFSKQLAARARVEIQPCKSQIGSGAMPLDLLPSYALVFEPVANKGESDAALQVLAKRFRELSKPVIGRIHDGKLYLDLRCLPKAEILLGLLPELVAD